MRADAVIVGGGPAGSVTAILLVRAGLDVVLIDRHAFPRPKPCGDCLSPNASRWLDRFGLLDDVEALRPAHLDGWRIVAPGGSRFEVRFDQLTDDRLVMTGIAVSRRKLDAMLLDRASAEGVRVHTGLRVTDLAPGHTGVRGADIDGEPFEIGARLVVGADGLRSVIARRAGAVARPARRLKLSLTAHVAGLRIHDALGEMHLAESMCVGIAPVTPGDDVANVTIVADTARFGRAVAHDPLTFFMRSLRRFEGLAGRCEDMSFVTAESGAGRVPQLLASGPFDVPVCRIASPGIALVGDAAGYFDPFTGQGIHSALEGAHYLARAAIPALLAGARTRPLLRRYARAARSRVRGRHLVQHMIEAVVSRPRVADGMISRLSGRPVVAGSLVATTGDLASVRSLFSPSVLLALAGPPVVEATHT